MRKIYILILLSSIYPSTIFADIQIVSKQQIITSSNTTDLDKIDFLFVRHDRITFVNPQKSMQDIK